MDNGSRIMGKIPSPKQLRGKVKRRGGALYFVLPRTPLQKLGYHVGTAVTFETHPGFVVISKAKRRTLRGRTTRR
jgi:antitoxin component of MazEF toxin-antitoxin module